MKKIRVSEEATYLLANVLIAFGVAMSAQADFGLSMIPAPAYILYLRVPALSFGQAEYIVQALLFVAFCLIMGKFRALYLTSFLTGILYATVLDAVRALIPALNPDLCPPGSFSMPVRIVLFVVAALITAMSIALYFKVYFYPQIYDYAARELCKKYNIPVAKFKTIYDIMFLVTAVVLSLVFFRALRGVGVGTVVLALVNGSLIGFALKLLDRFVEFYPRFPKLKEKFDPDFTAST